MDAASIGFLSVPFPIRDMNIMSTSGSRARLLLGALILLLLNTLYLAFTASPTLFYFANVVLHMVLGVVVSLIARAPAVAGLARLPLARTGCAVVLAAGLSLGVAIMFLGAAGQYRWLLPAHIALTVVGGAPLRICLPVVNALRAASRGARVAVGAAAVFILSDCTGVDRRGAYANRAAVTDTESKTPPWCPHR